MAKKIIQDVIGPKKAHLQHQINIKKIEEKPAEKLAFFIDKTKKSLPAPASLRSLGQQATRVQLGQGSRSEGARPAQSIATVLPIQRSGARPIWGGWAGNTLSPKEPGSPNLGRSADRVSPEAGAVAQSEARPPRLDVLGEAGQWQPADAYPPSRKATEGQGAFAGRQDRPGGEEAERSRYGLWTLAVASFIILLFAASALFSGATVLVTPQIKDFAIDSEFSAEKDSSTVLSYDVMTLSGEAGSNVAAAETVNLEKKATGLVILYNNFSASSQKLLIDTRLLAVNGKIYKTDKATTIPGYTTKNGQVVPGQVEIGVYADEAGAEYNTPPTDFTIIGFKGTPKYDKFYGRSKTEIAGGFKGSVNMVSDEEASRARTELRKKLAADLGARAKAELPKGFILFDDGIFLSYDDSGNNMAEVKNGIATMSTKATLAAIIFNETKLTGKVIETIIREPVEGLVIGNLKDLQFKIKNKEAIDPASLRAITFSVSGQGRVIWPIDSQKISADLAGKRKKDFKQILAAYPSIDKAEVILKPFWKSSFPDDSSKIKVINQAK